MISHKKLENNNLFYLHLAKINMRYFNIFSFYFVIKHPDKVVLFYIYECTFVYQYLNEIVCLKISNSNNSNKKFTITLRD